MLETEVSPTLLRTRIDIFSRRIRCLEEEMAVLAREIEETEARGETCLHLRSLELENDALLLEQLQYVHQMRLELERLEPTPSEDDSDSDQRNDIDRQKKIRQSLYFQVLGTTASKQDVEAGNGTEVPCEKEYGTKCQGTTPDFDCAICLDAYKDGQEIAWSRNETCPHFFHAECLTSWLRQSSVCPLCRNTISE